MKICGCVVLYNPDEEVYSNILTYKNLVNKLIVIDNSSDDEENITKAKLNLLDNIEYIKMNGNEGIAKALATGLEKAKMENYDWCLTIDQDSRISQNIGNNNIYYYLKKYNEYGIISLNYDEKFNNESEIINVKTWITSGNFININQYNKINGFKEELFIDYVDFDLCHQFYKKNIKIGVIPNIKIQHQIGKPITKMFLWRKFNCMNHSPIRYYYRYRNSRYLYKKDRMFYFKIYYHEMIIDFFKMILFEKNRKSKIKMIKKGLKDSKNNKLGKYEEKNEK